MPFLSDHSGFDALLGNKGTEESSSVFAVGGPFPHEIDFY